MAYVGHCPGLPYSVALACVLLFCLKVPQIAQKIPNLVVDQPFFVDGEVEWAFFVRYRRLFDQFQLIDQKKLL